MSLYLTEVIKKRSRSLSHNASFSSSPYKTTEDKEEIRLTKETKILNFLIEEETRFADLEKIELFFQRQAIKNYSRFNANQKKINDLKSELTEIEEMIELEIVLNMRMKHEEIVESYNLEIEKTNEKILEADYDLECYTNMHDRLYKTTYMLKEN